MAAPCRPLASQAAEPDCVGRGTAHRYAAGLCGRQRPAGVGRRVGTAVAGPGTGTVVQHATLGGGGGRRHFGLRSCSGVAGGALRFPRTARVDLAAGGAARHPALHHGLCVYGVVRLLGPFAASCTGRTRTRRSVAGSVRFISGRCADPQSRHIPIRLPVESRCLPADQRGL